VTPFLKTHATLLALQGAISSAMNAYAAAAGLASVTVYAGPEDDATMVFPCLILNVYRDEEIQNGGQRGNFSTGSGAAPPNLYSATYLEQMASTRGVPTNTAALEMFQRGDHLQAVFRVQKTQKLYASDGVTPQAMSAGFHVTMMYGEEGPWITYRSKERMGWKAVIYVLENPIYVVS